jgi:hypothetical protein
MTTAEETTNVNQPKGNAAQLEKPWSFYLVVVAILSVTIAFLIIMVLYSRLNIFDQENAANITAALSSLFGIVGTLVGAYFGIKATAEAQGKEAATSAVATPQGVTGLNPVSLALASLVPVVGGASLLVLRYYLRRMQDAA